jgi:hypothetical protein
MTPAGRNTQKSPKTGGSSYFLIEKPPAELFFKIKTFNKI